MTKAVDELMPPEERILNLNLTEISALAALRHAVNALEGLDYVIEDGIVKITTKEQARKRKTVEFYEIRDLTAPISNFPGAEINLNPSGFGAGVGGFDEEDEDDGEENRFVESVAQSEDKAALVDAFFADQASFPLVEDGVVHVVYRGEVEDVAVAGTLLDEAQPRALERLQGTNVHYRSYPIEPGARWEYALQVDFGDPIPDPLNPRTTPGIIYDGVGNVSYEGSVSELVPLDYTPAAHLREPEGERGRIETYEFESEALGNRRSVQVYLPAGYEQGEEEYPLLIVHRGPEWLEQGVMTHSLDNLIGTRVRPLVVAFVSPIGRWWYEAGGTGTEEYIAMLAEEFVPDIERRYRLSSRPEDRGLAGVEAFGLTAAYGVLLFPDVFGKAGVQSAALSLNGATGSVRGDLARQGLFERMRSAPTSDSVFYVDWNRYEKSMPDHSIDLRAEGRQLWSELRAQGYQVIGGEALDTHGWGSWRARTDELLVALFPL